MPPRHTRGSSCQSVAIRLVWAVGVPLAVLLQLVKHAPEVGIPLLLAAAAAGVVYVVRRARNAEQQCLEAARYAQVREVQSREIARYHSLGPTEFEHAVAYLCQRDGCTNVQVVGGAGD